MTKFLLHSYIKDFDNEHIKGMQDKLFSLGVLSKDYPEENLILLYNKYNNENKAPLELECRSVVINRNNFNIENYSCITPIYNGSAMNYLMMNQDKNKEIYKCYEGSLLSLFNFNNNWYFSSRRNVLRITDDTQNPHFKMFCDVIKQDGFNIETFIEKLDMNITYHFVLIHHQNKNIINYEKLFGKDYMKLCFIFARDKETNSEINSEDINSLFLTDNIFLPKKIESIENFDETNNNNLTSEPEDEGIIIKINNKVLKLQSIQYQFYKAIGVEKNLYKGFIHLYQNNKLGQYFKNNENTMKYSKIVNPIKTDESFDTMGTIDAVFKVITKELFELFKCLWDINTGDHKNKDVYEILPGEYKIMMYNIRKLYFINKKKNNIITFKNIYFFLKSLDVNIFEKFMRSRKLMLNLVRQESKNNVIQDFGKTTNIEKKILNKLCAIYTNKMFPEIMPDDVPQVKLS
jgi:hypothetical protein